MFSRVPWFGSHLKSFVEAKIAHHLVSQAWFYALVGFAWIGLIFTITVVCEKRQRLSNILVDCSFLAYLAFCGWSIYSEIAEYLKFSHSWTVYLTGASLLSGVLTGGLSLLVLLGVNKAIAYMPVHMQKEFGGGLFGKFHGLFNKENTKLISVSQ